MLNHTTVNVDSKGKWCWALLFKDSSKDSSTRNSAGICTPTWYPHVLVFIQGGTACIVYDGGTLRRGFAKLTRIQFEFGHTNITAVAQQLQLDVVIHLALEFAIRRHLTRHLTVEISGSAHLHPRVPRVPHQPNTSPIA